MKNTIDQLFTDIENLGGKFDSKEKYLVFLSDYSCQALEYHGREKSDGNINALIISKLSNVYDRVKLMNATTGKNEIALQTPPDSLIPQLIKGEVLDDAVVFSGGIKIWKGRYLN